MYTLFRLEQFLYNLSKKKWTKRELNIMLVFTLFSLIRKVDLISKNLSNLHIIIINRNKNSDVKLNEVHSDLEPIRL